MNKNKLILIISSLGMLFSGYMTYMHFQPSNSTCLLGGNECAQIVQGVYSEVLGFPVSVLGFSVFFLIAFFSFLEKSKTVSKKVFRLSIIGVFAAGYFNYIMIFKLGSLCPWCELSHISYLIIFFLSSANVKKFLAYSIIIFLLGASISWIANASGQHDEFAKCLTAKNATLYSAFWCPNCKEQKALFGQSMRYVNHVECSLPNGQQTAYCEKQGIKGYPTWDFGGKRVSGTQRLEELAEMSGCELK